MAGPQPLFYAPTALSKSKTEGLQMPSAIEVNQGQGLNYVENEFFWVLEIFWIFEAFWDFLTFCKTISRIFKKNQNIKK